MRNGKIPRIYGDVVSVNRKSPRKINGKQISVFLLKYTRDGKPSQHQILLYGKHRRANEYPGHRFLLEEMANGRRKVPSAQSFRLVHGNEMIQEFFKRYS